MPLYAILDSRYVSDESERLKSLFSGFCSDKEERVLGVLGVFDLWLLEATAQNLTLSALCQQGGGRKGGR